MTKRAFTLIEVLIVITIIGILVTITTQVYLSAQVSSRDNKRRSDIATIKNGLEQYYSDHHTYPAFKNNNRNVYAAKWQLEKNTDSANCPDIASNGYLAPFYMPSVPQDPIYTLKFAANCTPTPLANYYGQYLYLPFPQATGKTGYYLAARMGKAVNANFTSWPADLSEYSLTAYSTCTKQTYTATNCSVNYLVSNSHND